MTLSSRIERSVSQIGAVDRALERHVDRLVGHLRRRAGEIDDEAVASDLDRHGDRQVAPRRVGIVEEAVDIGGRGIVAIGSARIASRISRSE